MDYTRINDIVQKKFSIPSLYPYQQLVITNIIEGIEEDLEPHDQLVILPTGYGKSICFMVPGLLIKGLTLVIYPLLSLLNDQERRFRKIGAPAIVIRGGDDREERRKAVSYIASQERGFILTTPESLETNTVQAMMQSLPIRHIVIDEAHIVSFWGKSFRPAYARLGETISRLRVSQITAFTATAAAHTIDDIRQLLFLGRPVHLIEGMTDRPNIFYKVIPSISKVHDLHYLFSREQIQKPILVFCPRRALTEQLAYLFRMRLGSKEIYYYHAGMEKDERNYVEKWFHPSSDGILFATSAFGLGVDKPDVRTVIHHTVSSTVEAFLQESGRAGRDGKPSLSVVLHHWKDGLSASVKPFITSVSTCRRTTLLEGFSLQPDSCFGCDVCRKSVITLPDGYEQIMNLIRQYPRRFLTEQAALVLYGRMSYTVRRERLHDCRYFGILSSWQLDDIMEAVGSMTRLGILRTDTHGRLSQ